MPKAKPVPPDHSDTRHKRVHPIGGYLLAEGDLELNAGRPVSTIEVYNTGDRPIQVGSHYHFYEVNRLLEFDRDAAYGMRLDIPATTAVRFEPGDKKSVDLVPFGGKQRVYGFNGLVEGWTGAGPEPGYTPDRVSAAARAQARGFKTRPAGKSKPEAATRPEAKARPESKARPEAKSRPETKTRPEAKGPARGKDGAW